MGRTIGGHDRPGVVVDEVEDLDVSAVGQGPVGDVGLPALVRQSASKRMKDLFGRFFGSGMTKPRRMSTRQIVETDGVGSDLLAEVPVDGVWTGVEALLGQVLADGDDRILDVIAGPPRTVCGRLDRGSRAS